MILLHFVPGCGRGFEVGTGPQLADHLAFGTIVSAVTSVCDAMRRAGCRHLHLASLDDALAEAERLATMETRQLGNWLLGQILMHLSSTYEQSIDGMSYQSGWLSRLHFGGQSIG